jgi:uncharacterized protein YraI
MLIRSKSTHRQSVLVAGLVLAIFALFIMTGVAGASGGQCPSWQGLYYNNIDLSGQPTFARCDEAIDFDWHGLSPDPSIAVDQFSIRWTRVYNFSAGEYRFAATMDDGMRVYLDGQLIINDWYEGNVRTKEADVYLNSGPHNLVVEYFEKGGNAVAGFTWYALDSQPMPPYPDKPGHPPGGHPQQPPANPVQPILPPSSNVIYPTAEVKAAFLNVRSGPGVDNNVVAVLHQNTIVYLVARDMGGRWVLITTDGVKGWVNRFYLHTDFPYTSLPFVGQSGSPQQPPPPQQPQPKPQNTAMVNTSSLNVRNGPGVQFRAIAVVHGGTEVVVISKEANGWVQIAVPGSVTGFVNGSYLSY